MSALQVVEEIDGSALDPLVARLDDILAELRTAIDDHSEVTGADRIDRISALERLRGATAALQLSECVRFGQSEVAEQLAADVHPTAVGRGVADQIALSCRISPSLDPRVSAWPAVVVRPPPHLRRSGRRRPERAPG